MTTRKQLQTAYKELKPAMGVFQIRNTQSGKVLVDHSINMQAKWNRHRSELLFGTHNNKELQKDWKELGEKHFVFEVVSELGRKENEEYVDYEKELQELQYLILAEDDAVSTY